MGTNEMAHSDEVQQLVTLFTTALEKLRKGELFEEFLSAQDFSNLARALMQPETLGALKDCGIQIPPFEKSPITKVGPITLAFGEDATNPSATLTISDVEGKTSHFLAGEVALNFNAITFQLANKADHPKMMIVKSIATDPKQVQTANMGLQNPLQTLTDRYGNDKLFMQARHMVEKILRANEVKMHGFGLGLQPKPGESDLRVRIAISIPKPQ